jgi:hypothetical protein
VLVRKDTEHSGLAGQVLYLKLVLVVSRMCVRLEMECDGTVGFIRNVQCSVFEESRNKLSLFSCESKRSQLLSSTQKFYLQARHKLVFALLDVSATCCSHVREVQSYNDPSSVIVCRYAVNVHTSGLHNTQLMYSVTKVIQTKITNYHKNHAH